MRIRPRQPPAVRLRCIRQAKTTPGSRRNMPDSATKERRDMLMGIFLSLVPILLDYMTWSYICAIHLYGRTASARRASRSEGCRRGGATCIESPARRFRKRDGADGPHLATASKPRPKKTKTSVSRTLGRKTGGGSSPCVHVYAIGSRRLTSSRALLSVRALRSGSRREITCRSEPSGID